MCMYIYIYIYHLLFLEAGENHPFAYGLLRRKKAARWR